MAAMDSLQELFVHELKDLYNAEHQLAKALPKMAKAATHSQLKQAFEHHLQQTEEHIQRLEQVFSILGSTKGNVHCKAMEGLVEEGSELLKEEPSPVLDAALIGAAQKMEHYEICSYGTLATFAKQLGHDEVLKLLKLTIDEEEKTDKLLTRIAESEVNPLAHQFAK